MYNGEVISAAGSKCEGNYGQIKFYFYFSFFFARFYLMTMQFPCLKKSNQKPEQYLESNFHSIFNFNNKQYLSINSVKKYFIKVRSEQLYCRLSIVSQLNHAEIYNPDKAARSAHKAGIKM